MDAVNERRISRTPRGVRPLQRIESPQRQPGEMTHIHLPPIRNV